MQPMDSMVIFSIRFLWLNNPKASFKIFVLADDYFFKQVSTPWQSALRMLGSLVSLSFMLLLFLFDIIQHIFQILILFQT